MSSKNNKKSRDANIIQPNPQPPIPKSRILSGFLAIMEYEVYISEAAVFGEGYSFQPHHFTSAASAVPI